MRKIKYFNKFSTMIAVFLITLIAGGFWMNAAAAETYQMSFQVSAGVDDAEELIESGEMSIDSSDLEIAEEHPGEGDLQLIGIRFSNVTIPPGAVVEEAYIQFACDEAKNGTPFNVSIYGEAAGDSLPYTGEIYNISSRTKTLSSAVWSDIADWEVVHEAGENQKTPDLTGVIQEIVDLPGWAQGNALAIIIQGTGTRTAESYDGEPDLAPVLVVTFTGELQGASNDKYRLVWNDDPSSTMVIAWDQLRGDNPMVCYGTVDHQQDWEQYQFSQAPDRVEQYRGMNNHFVKLTGLLPDTAYYFVIKDSETVSERMWFKTAPDTPQAFTFISGGDTKSSGDAYEAGKNSNKMVPKLRPLFVEFNGDFCSGDGTDDNRWKDWLTNWAVLTKASDGRVFPILPVHGNHENGDYEVLYHLFWAGNQDSGQSAHYTYYGLSFAGNLLKVIALNSELIAIPGAFDAQTAWLESELAASSENVFVTTGYHKPVRPHTSGKAENDYLMPWAQLFYDYSVNLSFDADSHMHKITFPIRPSEEPGSYMGFIRDDQSGTMYLGEGSWGAWARPADDGKPWTLNSAQMQQFKLFHVFPAENGEPARIDIRTVVTGLHGDSGELIDLVEGVGENSEADVFAIPENTTLVDIPFYGQVISYPFTAVEGESPAAPFDLTGGAVSYSEIHLNWTYNNDPQSPAEKIYLERKIGTDGQWIEVAINISPDTLTYVQTDLHDGTDYYYRIRAWNIFGFSEYSNEALVSTPVDARLKAEFQQGLDEYADAVDVELIEAMPDYSSSSGASLTVDNNSGNGDRVHGLIRFENIFGENKGRIPGNAVITQAFLRVRTMNSTGNNISIHRMLVDWAPDTTWNLMDGGINPDDLEAVAEPDDILQAPQAGNYHTFDITASLIAWFDDPSVNFGWGQLNDGSNGWDYYTSEWQVQEERPLLTVFYKIRGDIDGDGDIDRDDINIIKSHKKESAEVCPECDIDEDGVITMLDAQKLRKICTRKGCRCE